MSVLIKGMEMPVDCRDCPFEMYYMNCGETKCRATGKILADFYKPIPFEGRAEECPLVEVPPHGALIDADKIPWRSGTWEANFDYVTRQDMYNFVPTIIEAEEVYASGCDTAGNYRWVGTHSGEHIIKAEEET